MFVSWLQCGENHREAKHVESQMVGCFGRGFDSPQLHHLSEIGLTQLCQAFFMRKGDFSYLLNITERLKSKSDEESEALHKMDFINRLEIERVIDVLKIKYGFDKLIMQLSESQKANIEIVFFVMKLNRVISHIQFFELFEMLILPF